MDGKKGNGGNGGNGGADCSFEENKLRDFEEQLTQA